MLYLLDANVLIDANRDYYPLDRVPEFWEWIAFQGSKGRVKLPIEIYEEVRAGTDGLASWIRDARVREALLLDAEADPALVSRATANGYAPDLTESEIVKVGRDPFLISYALRDPSRHCIVTTETSKPRKTRANRHLPDAAGSLGVDTRNTFELTRELDFTTGWRKT
jgi:hypothetical protein